MLLPTLTLFSAAAWLVLAFGRGGFWRIAPVESDPAPPPAVWPPVLIVVPARNEADTIGDTIASLLSQTYVGPFFVTVVDDASTDGTSDRAREAARASGRQDRLAVVAGGPLPEGWAGKLWAVEQGLRHARAAHGEARYALLTDADIVHDPRNLARLVARAEARALDLVSLMVRLRVASFWDRLLIPAFVFFFALLYPFRRVASRGRREAAAAGGCMLVRLDTLDRVGGIESICDALIDDCALARRFKHLGYGLWLGYGENTRSARRYRGLGDIWNMVARTAYTQLRYSPLLLAGTVVGMIAVFIVPVAGVVTGLARGDATLIVAGTLAWFLMTACYAPMLAYYRVSWLLAPALPLVAALYTLMTLTSAWRHARGVGGGWKGRTYGRRGPMGGASAPDDGGR